MKKIAFPFVFVMCATLMYAQNAPKRFKIAKSSKETNSSFDFESLQEIVANASLTGHAYIFKKNGKNYYYAGDPTEVQTLFLNSVESHQPQNNSNCPQPLPTNSVCRNGYLIQKM